ncbi:MAG: tyrosine-type recombinase/integrase [Spirochaetes bacterium]|nr:tyrosine-type recombinase/integrase [Spirochaetota bacterium]
MEGLKKPKRNSVRPVPAPQVVIEALQECMRTCPWESSFLLWNYRTPDRPVGRDTLQRGFITLLHRIGISEQERVERNLTFHSLRHTYVSLSRSAGIPGFIIQRIVGHKSLEMTEGYTHATLVDFQHAKLRMEEAFTRAEG